MELATPKFDLALQYFADVYLPVSVPNVYTYSIPSAYLHKISVGMRVVVPFGKKRILTAIVASIHQKKPELYSTKNILELLDDTPTVLPTQMIFFKWIAQYYMCHMGDVLHQAIPSGLKIDSDLKVQLHPLYTLRAPHQTFTESESKVLSMLQWKEVYSYEELEKSLGYKNLYNILQSLVKKESILLLDEIKEKFKPKIIKVITWHPHIQAMGPAGLPDLIQKYDHKPALQDVLLQLMALFRSAQSLTLEDQFVAWSELKEAQLSESSIRTLCRHEVLEIKEHVISRLKEEMSLYKEPQEEVKQLSAPQLEAYQSILTAFETKQTVLLHGVTGSGKTHIYIKLIENVLRQGQQVLFMLPEIALTTQMVLRLKKVFGDKLGVFHSKYSDNERVEVWKSVANQEISLVMGVRSSIYLPYKDLGLIIIDEEHEPSFKQQDGAPRVQSRDAALYLAHLHHAKVLLGSATPSFESYHNALSQKYALVELQKRYEEHVLPKIHYIDLKEKRRKKEIQYEFSKDLVEAIQKTHSEGQQSILFQNRRGFSPLLECTDCGFVPKCHQCDVSLTYHQFRNELKCHYCGYTEKTFRICPACGSQELSPVGFGTEKLEEDAKELFPTFTIQRVDLETTRSKHSLAQIIQGVESGNVDMIIGTQMITKGLDFKKVNLVGVFDIDRMLHFPDFRSHERVYQLLTQVAGRAGRAGQASQVLVQTYSPTHPVFDFVQKGDYSGFYFKEMEERQRFHYPPYCRIIKIELRCANKEKLIEIADLYKQTLIRWLGAKRVLGPEVPGIDKIKGLFHRNFHIKLEKSIQNLAGVKSKIMQSTGQFVAEHKAGAVHFYFDVDPVY